MAGMSYLIATETPDAFYQRARNFVEESAFAGEIHWQKSVSTEQVTEASFLRETAWVILNSGFREQTARKLFGNISLSFYDWQSAADINKDRDACIAMALDSFNHQAKLNAMADAAAIVLEAGMEKITQRLNDGPIEFLTSLNFIGSVTSWHLAKNLGCDVAKPDRHLVRAARHFGFECVHSFCHTLSRTSHDKVSVVDLVVWRYLSSNQYEFAN